MPLQWLLDQDGSGPFMTVLQSNPGRLINLAYGQTQTSPNVPPTPPANPNANLAELQFHAILIINTMTRKDDDWLQNQTQLVTNLLKIWVSEPFQERHRKIVSISICWKLLCVICLPVHDL